MGMVFEPKAPHVPHLALRRLTESDMAAYRALWMQCVQECPFATRFTPLEAEARPEEWFRTLLTHKIIYGYEAHASLQGFVVLECGGAMQKTAHKAVLGPLYVAPQVRRCGVGRALMEKALGKAAEMGAEQVRLGVAMDNSRAIRLYEIVGFQVYGTELHALKLAGGYVDELLMVKFLR